MTPDEHTISESFLDVGDSHSLYIHEWGYKEAKHSIIFLHGGPGAGTGDKHKLLFNPKTQRVIFFDQRGCGKSLPHGSLKHNTTADLVEDIERIAKHVPLTSFILAGSSWGTTLAFAYGLKYPKRVEAMVLRGILTCSRSEIDWLDQGHWSVHFPEVWDTYLDQTPKTYQANPTAYHSKRALSANEQAAKLSAYAYNNVEAALLSLDDRFTPQPFTDYDPTSTRIEMFYTANRAFMPERYIIKNAHKLTMPIWLIQGRYDMVCPPVTAYEMQHKLPNSRLILTMAGHGNDRSNYEIAKTILAELTHV